MDLERGLGEMVLSIWIAAAAVTDQQRRSPQMGVSVVAHRLDQGGIVGTNGPGTWTW
ncbi:hypothetical protein BCR33DRAFT_718882 [Rhizoclosmatium globosum]|uniref:Uncharacterized protein n=1 Tax=Rhizoclosmatium globosum TaxID=329046 RepID=A0A1Y2C2F4_9FUNG|nr:hypothetical protein BCR33DRAFT_718881 [Rhizoclosmatium globosum]ORY41222.1 hypothetical protein BCR33DRAFT_718882 [Rhizoclosmatium globosum]|eukprot:ORY41221.1 hypothetical protein BCR33DRAFT_718881 [Rhizoclosmatium globosum]